LERDQARAARRCGRSSCPPELNAPNPPVPVVLRRFKSSLLGTCRPQASKRHCKP
jgi:hypothetical protein